jgi:hypothetical protein
MSRILIASLFFLISSFLFSQKANRIIRDTAFKTNDIISLPLPPFCLGRGCLDGISLDTYDSLKIISAFIKKHPKLVFQIETNTDQRGDATKNKILSEQRANFIRKILIEQDGVDSTSIFAKGYGEKNPIYSQKQIDALKTMEEKEKLYSQNRRTVLRVIDKNNIDFSPTHCIDPNIKNSEKIKDKPAVPK